MLGTQNVTSPPPLTNPPITTRSHTDETSTTVVIKNKYWTNAHQHVLMILHKYAYTFTQRYHAQYLNYKQILYNYKIPVIVMSSLSSLLALSNVGYVPTEYTKYVSLTTGILNAIMVIINVIEHTKKIDLTANGAFAAFIGFRNITHDIGVILRIPLNERDEDGHNTIKKFYTKFSQLLNRSPVLKIEPPDLLLLEQSMMQTSIPISPPSFDHELDIHSDLSVLDNNDSDLQIFPYPSKQESKTLTRENSRSETKNDKTNIKNDKAVELTPYPNENPMMDDIDMIAVTNEL